MPGYCLMSMGTRDGCVPWTEGCGFTGQLLCSMLEGGVKRPGAPSGLPSFNPRSQLMRREFHVSIGPGIT